MPGPADIASGNVALRMILSVSITPAALNATTAATETKTIPGLLTTDIIGAVRYGGAWTVTASIANARVSAVNTLAVTFVNPSAGSVTPPAGTYYFEVIRLSNPTAPSALV